MDGEEILNLSFNDSDVQRKDSFFITIVEHLFIQVKVLSNTQFISYMILD